MMSEADVLPERTRRRRTRQEGASRRARAPGPIGGKKGHPIPWLTLPADPTGTALLWRALEALSWERRWLVWVAPPRRPTAQELRSRGLDVRHVLVVPLRPNLNPLPITEQALASGHCSAVLVWPGAAVSQDQLARLQAAAQQGDALCLLWPPLSVAAETGVRTDPLYPSQSAAP